MRMSIRRQTARCSSLAAVLFLFSGGASGQTWKPAPTPLSTKYAADVDPAAPHPEHPRPTLMRSEWTNLNGLWDYAVTAIAAPPPSTYEGKILVPFPIESSLSGVGRVLEPTQRLHYRRTVRTPDSYAGRRLLLHFGAVDWRAEVFIDGVLLGVHEGGFDPFVFDATEMLKPGRDHELTVVVEDPTDKGGQPRGKQWGKPQGIWYLRSSGIWRTVWLEPVHQDGIRDVRTTARADLGRAVVRFSGPPPGTTVRAEARFPDGTKFSASMTVPAEGSGEHELVIAIPKPRRWTPDDPVLYDLTLGVFRNDDGKPLDAIASYFAFRDIAVKKDDAGINRIHLNGVPLFQFGPLDQGFWPDGLYTAPTDEALASDVEAVKHMGGNMLRKHVKVESERFYSWCDRLGVLVWQDIPSGFEPGKGDQAPLEGRWRDNFRREMREIVADYSRHPSIVVWVPFNEGWGQFETESVTAELMAADPSRLVINASGWTDKKVGHLIDVHAYPGPAMAPVEELRGSVLGEFGGLGLPIPEHTWVKKDNWGYVSFKDAATLTDAYVRLLGDLPPLIADGLSAAVYTQTTDVESEVNGWLTYDRTVWKVDPDRARAAALPLYMPPPQVRIVVPRAGQGPAAVWRYTTKDPGPDFGALDFDPSAWMEGPAGFGTKGTPRAVVGTEWKTEDLWIRRTFDLAGKSPSAPAWSLHHDEDVEIWLNGVSVFAERGFTSAYVLRPFSAAARAALKPGRNVLALRCRQTTGGLYLDCGIVDLSPPTAAL